MIENDVIQESLGVKQEEVKAPINTEQKVDEPVKTDVAPTVDYDAILKEKTGGRFKKWEDLTKIGESKPIDFKNEASKTVFELLKDGKVSEAASILEKQRLVSNVETMSNEDAITLKLRLENPEWTDEEIRDEFNSKYVREADEELMNDEEKVAYQKEKKRIEREIKKEAKAAKDFLASQKVEISLPDITVYDEKSIVDRYLLSEQAKADQMRQQFLESVDKGVETLDDFTINYKDEEVQFEGKFSITPEEMQSLKDSIKKGNDFIDGSRYFKDGKYDAKKLAEDNYWLDNREKIIQSFVTQAISKTKAELIKGMKQIDYSDNPKGVKKADANEQYMSLVDQVFGI